MVNIQTDLKYTLCPRCKGSGKLMVFGYLQYDAQLIPKEITCPVCKGRGRILSIRKGGIK